MKETVFIIYTLLFGTQLFAQNEIHLKSGEIIDCQVKSFNNGDLAADFKGNIIHLKMAEIASIFFEKTQPKIDTTKPLIEIPKPIEKGELKGVVTYFFNNNYGDKPDIGAEVWIYKIIDDEDEKKLNDFLKLELASTIRERQINNPDESIDTNELKKLDAYPYKKFSELSLRVSKMIIDIEYRENRLNITVDGNGNYSAKLEPGKYGIIARSNHEINNHMNTLMNEPKMLPDVVDIKPNETVDKSFRFQ